MKAALDLLRMFEGYRDTPYWDVNAYRVGYGSDTVTTANGRVVPVQQGMTVSREDAERDLARRVSTEFGPRIVEKVGREAWANMTDGQRASLISITYNYGSLPDSVAQAARSGDPSATFKAIRDLGEHNGGVNAKRREQEAAIYAGGALPAGGLPGDPQARNAVEAAYRAGRMSPEDAALYEQGMAEGVFAKADRPDPLAIYEAAARRRPAPILKPITFNLPGL